MYFDQAKFGCRLRTLRKRRRMTQETLAGALNISIVLQKNCEYFLLEICKPLQCKASEAKISGLKPPDNKTL